jgi:K+-transporting ATPase KdpF subunit
VKGQPVHLGDFEVTVGGFGLFYLRGSEDGNPAGQGYGFATYRVPTLGNADFRRWLVRLGRLREAQQHGRSACDLRAADSMGEGPDARRRLVERRELDRLPQPGLVYAFGHWTAYAAYSIKNGDSSGNGGLSSSATRSEERRHVGRDLSRRDGRALLVGRRLRAALRPDLRETSMGWEDVLGLAVSVALLGFLLRAMLRAEKA